MRNFSRIYLPAIMTRLLNMELENQCSTFTNWDIYRQSYSYTPITGKNIWSISSHWMGTLILSSITNECPYEPKVQYRGWELQYRMAGQMEIYESCLNYMHHTCIIQPKPDLEWKPQKAWKSPPVPVNHFSFLKIQPTIPTKNKVVLILNCSTSGKEV